MPPSPKSRLGRALALLSLAAFFIFVRVAAHLPGATPRPASSAVTVTDPCDSRALSVTPAAASAEAPQRDAKCTSCCEGARPVTAQASESAARVRRRRCSLPLPRLLQAAPETLTIVGDGADLRVESSESPRGSCGGMELLRQILTGGPGMEPLLGSSLVPLAPLRDGGCDLHRAVQELVPHHMNTASGRHNFTLLQDCDAPPCCPQLLRKLAARYPGASLFAVQSDRGGEDEGTGGMPPNLWRLTPAVTARAQSERRTIARACARDEGCFTLQIAHALQGHPLLRGGRRVDGSAGEHSTPVSRSAQRSVERAVLWEYRDDAGERGDDDSARDSNADAQEAAEENEIARNQASAEAAVKHAALLRAANAMTQHALVRMVNRRISGPDAADELPREEPQQPQQQQQQPQQQ